MNEDIKNEIWNAVALADRIAISGHIKADGDSVGSTMAMYIYIMKKFPQKEVYVYMDNLPDVFGYLCDKYDIITDHRDVKPDLFIALDCSDSSRLGQCEEYFYNSKLTINIDHHISNLSYAKINYYVPDASSTGEVLYGLMDEEYIEGDVATALYTAIIHDTGVFQYSNTSRKTMEIGGALLEKGVPSDVIIDKSFYEKTYTQNKLLARCILESKMYIDDKCLVAIATNEMFDDLGAGPADLEGIVNQLRITKGVLVAVLIHEVDQGEFKISMRANGSAADVSKVALSYGGGGHVKAAGCTLYGEIDEVVVRLVNSIKEELACGGQI